MIAMRLNSFSPTVEVTCQYSVANGGGTGREYPKNLIDSQNQNWNKWCACDCIDGKSWIRVDFKQQLTFCGIATKTANDCPHRDPR